MPPEIKTFKQLIAWLVREHHDGVWYAMSKKLQISSGLVYQWRDGTVKRPSDEHIDALVKAYRLDWWTVWGIITGRKPPSAAVILAALGLSILLSGSAMATPLPVDNHAILSNGNAAYRNRRIYRWWRYLRSRCEQYVVCNCATRGQLLAGLARV